MKILPNDTNQASTADLLDTLRSIEKDALQRLKEPLYKGRVQAINDGNFIEQTTMLQSRMSKSGLKYRLSLSQASLVDMNSYASFVFSLLGPLSQTAALCGYIFTAIETAVDFVEVDPTGAHEEVFKQALNFVDSCSQAIGGIIAQSREITYTDQMRSTSIHNYECLINFLIELILCLGNVLGTFKLGAVN